MKAFLSTYGVVDRIVFRINVFVVAAILSVMSGIVFYGVIARYLFNAPLFWGEETARFLMFFLVLTGSALGLRLSQHPRLTMFVDLFPEHHRRKMIFLGDAITLNRILAMAMAILGMLTIFGLGARFPIPNNIGDWLGIASGVLWAVATVRLRMSESHSAIELTAGFFQWSLIFSASAAFLLAPAYIPRIEQALPTLPLLLIFMALLVLPGTYASLWGPKYLSPGIVGLLFMTEIVVGAISVALLAGEPFGIRELTGVLLIAGASMLEPLLALRRRRRNLNPND